MKRKKRLKYVLLFMVLFGILLAGCSNRKESVRKKYKVTKEDLSYALPKIGEAVLLEATVEVGTKGTITVASVGSPNTEILQKAGEILSEKGYLLKIEVCEDYSTPNQLLSEGKVDCNFYQHPAFLERYNMEHGTRLMEFAKIHYEPMAIYSTKTNDLTEVSRGAVVVIPKNPTAMAQALWLLEQEGLLTLMEDADLTAVEEDISENPLELKIETAPEEEILGKLQEAELVLCHTGYVLKEGMDYEKILLATETKESMTANALAQTIVVKDPENEGARILTQVLMSQRMKEFMETQYQGSIFRMDERSPEGDEEENLQKENLQQEETELK